MFTLASRPQTIGKVLDSGFKLYMAGLKRVLLLAFLASLVWVPMSLMMPAVDPATGMPTTAMSTTAVISMLLYMLLALGLALVLAAGIYYILGSVAAGKETTKGVALGRGMQCLFPLLGATILYGLGIFGGMLLLIVPGLFLMVALMFYSPAIVLDDDGAMASLKRSYSLVKGNWWRTATVLSVPMFLIIVASLVVAMVLLPLLYVAGADLETWSEVVGNGIDVLVGAFTTPLMYAMVIVQYHDLKLRKEGGDLEARIGGLDRGP